MKYVIVFLVIILIQSCKRDNAFFGELAYRYAPVHYQDTDNSNARADFISKFDYDNNWIGTDNWEHLGTGNLAAHVYYSVTETSTHYGILSMHFSIQGIGPITPLTRNMKTASVPLIPRQAAQQLLCIL